MPVDIDREERGKGRYEGRKEGGQLSPAAFRFL